MKWYNPKSFSYFKETLELSFSSIIHTHMLQKLFETSVQLNICNFLGLFIRQICHLLSTCGIWLVGNLLVQLQKMNFGSAFKQIWKSLSQGDIQNLILYHEEYQRLLQHVVLHQILISDTFLL